MQKPTRTCLLIVFCLLSSVFCPPAYANNITTSNVTINTQSTANKTCVVQFDISWQNSWRNPMNYDAAWVFVKYSTDGGSTWAHATLKASGTNPSGFSGGSGTGVDIIVPSEKKGAFIQRAAAGKGTVTATGVQLVWDWGADGLSQNSATPISLDTDLRVKVFAVEMVYVGTGSFYIGDGNGVTQATGALHQIDMTGVKIGTLLEQTIRGDATYDDSTLNSGIGIQGDGGLDTNYDGIIENPNFPTGYNASYVMKYEISQGQYRDFLNTLTRAQQNSRVSSNVSLDAPENIYVMSNSAAVSNRNGICAPAFGNGTASPITFGCDLNGDGIYNEAFDGEWIACNWLSWADLVAYADWAALRPMTELEFEKACRAVISKVLGEYAWGNIGITTTNSVRSGTNGTSSEIAGSPESGQNGLCDYNNNAIGGPLRCGFAAGSNTTRAQAGSSYYGVMELSGNLWERAVTLGNATGRNFTGLNGDGSLDTNGNANVANWPGINAVGAGFRGGDWSNIGAYAQVSNRVKAANTVATRDNNSGGRLVRTAT